MFIFNKKHCVPVQFVLFFLSFPVGGLYFLFFFNSFTHLNIAMSIFLLFCSILLSKIWPLPSRPHWKQLPFWYKGKLQMKLFRCILENWTSSLAIVLVKLNTRKAKTRSVCGMAGETCVSLLLSGCFAMGLPPQTMVHAVWHPVAADAGAVKQVYKPYLITEAALAVMR